MSTNWKKLYAMKAQAKSQLLRVCCNLNNDSGIYIFARNDENGVNFCYVGQAKHLEDRLISHIIGYSQRIDISLKKRKLYDKEKNPNGWNLHVINCPEQELDEQEKHYISSYINLGYQMYNKTLGSQSEGKVSINDGQSSKGYYDGVKQGFENCRKYVAEMFNKYFEFTYKKLNKDGTPSKLIVRKKQEFEDFLKIK